MMKYNKVLIRFVIPKNYLDKIINKVCPLGAGNTHNYTYCTKYTKCYGTFKPGIKAKPFIGKKNVINHVKGICLEITCDTKLLTKVIKKIKEIHPYEEPDIEIIPLLAID